MSKVKDLSKRVFLKYIKGYGNEQNYWDSRWNLGLQAEVRSGEKLKSTMATIEKIMLENKCTSFLDVGCGQAELRKLHGYVGLDFSFEGLKKSGLKEAIYADITNNIPLPDKSFDVVFTSVVLLHIPPNKIDRAVSNLCRVAKKCLVLMEPKYNPVPLNVKVQPHCFNHNLPKLINKYFDGQVFFL
jgi:SAM-dependent methyltransferase